MSFSLDFIQYTYESQFLFKIIVVKWKGGDGMATIVAIEGLKI